jgi:hypothetical protein
VLGTTTVRPPAETGRQRSGHSSQTLPNESTGKAPMLSTGLVGDAADQSGQLRPDTTPSGLYLGIRRAFTSSPRLGNRLRVSGDVIPDESAGGATGWSTRFMSDGWSGNREISPDKRLPGTGADRPFDGSHYPARENGGSEDRLPGSGLRHGSLPWLRPNHGPRFFGCLI